MTEIRYTKNEEMAKIPSLTISKDLTERRRVVQSLTMFDDEFFSTVMADKDVCEEVLRVLTGIEDLVLKDGKAQYNLRNLGGHSVVLDFFGEDSKGQLYNIEVQKENQGHHKKRVRYYQGLIDTSMLDKGVPYEKLPELYLIYLTKFDLFKLGRVKYEVHRIIEGTDIRLDDGVHEVYINAANEDGTLVSALLQFFLATSSSHTAFPKLSERIQYFKEQKEGIKHMSEVVERLIEQKKKEWQQEAWSGGREEGLELGLGKGEERAKEIVVRNAVKMGLSIDAISQLTGLSEKEIRAVEADDQEK